MSPPPPDDYSGVRRLLKLKRYEQPPPRYFDGLSDGVLHRLRGPEGLRQQSLIRALGLRFGLKPVLFYALGALCSLLAGYGVVSLLAKPSETDRDRSRSAGVLDSPTPQAAPSSAGGTILISEPSAEASVTSTNPVLSPGTLTFPVDPSKIKSGSSTYRPR
jgi:hypothetical protein